MRNRIFSLFLLLFLAVGSALAQERTLAPEDLWSLGRVNLFDVSPDDSLVLFGVKYYDLESNSGNLDLYSIRLDGGSKGVPARLTETPENESNACYRPDGKKIGFLREDKLWEMDPDGSNARQVSDISMNGFAYSPDGSHILYVQDVYYANPADTILAGLPRTSGRIYDDLMFRHWDDWADNKYANLFYIGYADGKLVGEPVNIQNEPFDSPMQPFGGMEQIAWSPDGKQIAYTCKRSHGVEDATGTNSDVFLYDLASGRTENISDGMPGYDMEPAFSPNGRFIAWNSQEHPGYEADRMRIFIRDLQSGERWEMTTTMDQNARHPKWSPQGDAIFFLSEYQGTQEIWGVNFTRHGKLQRLSTGFYDFTDFIPTGKNTFAAVRNSLSEPPEIFRYVLETSTAKQLTYTNKDFLEKIKMGKVLKRMTLTTDNKRMHSWVVYPPGFDETKKYPVILYCLGGPQGMVSQSWSYRWNLQLFAAQGYIVIAPNRRGTFGFGQAWTDAITGDWGGQPMQDLLSAIDDIKREPYADSTRMAAIGASYGGYSVYWLEGHNEGRFKTFIAHGGLFSLKGFYGSTDELFFANHDIGGPYWQDTIPKMYLKDSPDLFVQNWNTPLLVIHNGRDYRVPLEQGLQAYTAARLKGIPSRFLYFPDENHHVVKPQNTVLWHRTMLEWLRKYL
ncbi:MAG: S9 family peptidase [Lewinellaceae bacterium]|nr:S9 family peptidase [Lewinellaceae bacterium]